MADPKLEALIRMKIQKQMQPNPEPPIFDDTKPQPEVPQPPSPDERPINTMLENGASFADFAPEQTAGRPFAMGLDMMAENNNDLYHKMRRTDVNGMQASPATRANAFPYDPRTKVDPESLARTQAFMNPTGPQGRELLMRAVVEQMRKGGQMLQGGASSAQAAIQQALQQQYNPGGQPSSVPGTPMSQPPRR